MKAARIVVLAVALGAGGIAAYLASGSKEAPPAPAPVVQTIDTVEILVAKGAIHMGQVGGGARQRTQWAARAIRRRRQPLRALEGPPERHRAARRLDPPLALRRRRA